MPTSELLAKVVRFGVVSGVGLGLDVCIFLALSALNVRAGIANFVSASVAVTFVYFASTRKVFRYQGQFLFRLFLAYLVYQVIAVALASGAVDGIAGLGALPIVAKLLILPVTFSSNYAFMAWLTKPRLTEPRT
jgi:putative flippase GtrA